MNTSSLNQAMKHFAWVWENFLFNFARYKRKCILEAWYHGAVAIPNKENPDFHRNSERLSRYREWMFEQHYVSLDRHEQREIDQRTHPSQSWKFCERAEQIAEHLKHDLSHCDYVQDVGVCQYHFGLLVFIVDLRRDPGFKKLIHDVPYFYHGFQVKIVHTYLSGQGALIVERFLSTADVKKLREAG